MADRIITNQDIENAARYCERCMHAAGCVISPEEFARSTASLTAYKVTIDLGDIRKPITVGSYACEWEAIMAKEACESGISIRMEAVLKDRFDEPKPKLRKDKRVTDDRVTTICYGKEKEWESRSDAMAFFLAGMMATEGSEMDRYAKIYSDLEDGKKICRDYYCY